jgi:hypothetical protein
MIEEIFFSCRKKGIMNNANFFMFLLPNFHSKKLSMTLNQYIGCSNSMNINHYKYILVVS